MPNKNPLILSFLMAAVMCNTAVEAQICPPGSSVLSMSTDAPPCIFCNDSIARFTYVPLEVDTLGMDSLSMDSTMQEFRNYSPEWVEAGDIYHDQWLDLYSIRSLNDTVDTLNVYDAPVFIFAHAEGVPASSLYNKGRQFQDLGVNFIAWESVQNSSAYSDSTVLTEYDLWEYGNEDFQMVLDWVHENSEEYNFDSNRIFVGGTSRGSAMSFHGLDRDEPSIKGVYMIQGFPDGHWTRVPFADEEGCTIERLDAAVTSGYPPLVMRFDYPMGVSYNGHDPLHGIEIMEAYGRKAGNTKVRIDYNLGDTNYWLIDVLNFINDPVLFYGSKPAGVYSDNLPTQGYQDSLGVLVQPLSVIRSDTTYSNGDTGIRFQWSKSNWTDSLFFTNPTEIKCRGRIGRASSLNDQSIGENKDNFIFEETYAFPDSGVYFYPKEGYMNTCDMPGADSSLVLFSDRSYGFQVKCNVKQHDFIPDYFEDRTWTPYSNLMVFQGPCDSTYNDLGSINLGTIVVKSIEEDVLLLEFRIDIQGLIQVTLFTMDGMKKTISRTISNSDLDQPFDISRLSPGPYGVKLDWAEGSYALYFMKP